MLQLSQTLSQGALGLLSPNLCFASATPPPPNKNKNVAGWVRACGNQHGGQIGADLGAMRLESVVRTPLLSIVVGQSVVLAWRAGWSDGPKCDETARHNADKSLDNNNNNNNNTALHCCSLIAPAAASSALH